MISVHAFHTATLLLDGRVLVVGGLVNDRLDGQPSVSAEMYDPAHGSWAATGRLVQARWDHTATLLPDGTVLVAGGHVNGARPLATAEVFDSTTGRWSAASSMNRGRGGHTATTLRDGRVLALGGGAEATELEGGPRSATAEIYDPGSREWTVTRSMVQARMGFSATLLADGRVLVAGGDGDFDGAELFDPRTAKWSPTGSMHAGRFGHTATLLTDDTVLVTGGCACSEPGALASAEVYDPETGRWTATGSMGTARIFHTATLLADGKVLVVNTGLSGDRPASAEVFDPKTGTWTATARPSRSRYGYTATLLENGTVLLVGDYDDNGEAYAEMFDPGTGS